MKYFILMLAVPLIASAASDEWLAEYLKSKSYQCRLDQNLYEMQIDDHSNFILNRLYDNLMGRGYTVKSIVPLASQRKIGIFPGVKHFDFFVLEKVIVVTSNRDYWLQTNLGKSARAPSQEGLWLPLAITDPGAGKACILSRINFTEATWDLAPVVNLVAGEPPRVVEVEVVQVMDGP